MIKNIIFDLGKVLIDYDWSILYRKLDRKISEEDLNDNAELLLDFDAGKLSPKEFYTIIRSRFDLNHSFEEFKNIWCEIFTEIPEMIALAETLQKKYQLFLFSNTDRLHFPHIWKNFTSLQIFGRNLMLSYELRSVKPHKESYIRAINKFSLNATECLFIDDKAENVKAARQIGMRGLRHKSVYSTIDKLKGCGIM